MNFYNLLSRIVKFGQDLYTNFLALWDTMTTPISEAFEGHAIISAAIRAYPELANSSLIDMLLGSALGVFVTLTLIKWVIGIIM